VVLFGGRFPCMWAPRSGHGSAVTVIGGMPEVRRIDEIDTVQVISAWRTLPSRCAAEVTPDLSAE